MTQDPLIVGTDFKESSDLGITTSLKQTDWLSQEGQLTPLGLMLVDSIHAAWDFALSDLENRRARLKALTKALQKASLTPLETSAEDSVSSIQKLISVVTQTSQDTNETSNAQDLT